MANYAALIDVLSVAGSRLSDGSVNASGKVWFFQPGTNTPVNVYSNATATTIVTQPVTLTSGGLLNTSSFPNGIYATQPVRLYIEDVNGTAVSDTTYIPATAGDVGVSNAGFTDSTLDGVLTKLYTSTGGRNGTYLIATGQTERPIGTTITELSVSVKSFGAKGNGVAIDTTAIQNAANYVIALGGGTLYFPPGTYITDQVITLTNATGVVIEGSGGALVKTTHATANVFTLATCNYCSIRNLSISADGTSGAGIQSSGTHLDIDSVVIVNCQTGINVSGSLINIRGSFVDAVGGGAAQRGIVSTATDVSISGGRVTASSGAAIEFASTAARTSVQGVSTGAGGATATGVLFNANLSGSIFTISGCTGLGGCTTPINVTGVAVWPGIRQWGNGVRGPTPLSFATGTTQTPNVMVGDEIVLNASSGGAAVVTVHIPTITPSGADADNRYYDFVFINGAGGAVTWTLDATYVLDGATGIPGTNGHTVQVRFRWDSGTSKFRECSRGDTVT